MGANSPWASRQRPRELEAIQETASWKPSIRVPLGGVAWQSVTESTETFRSSRVTVTVTDTELVVRSANSPAEGAGEPPPAEVPAGKPWGARVPA